MLLLQVITGAWLSFTVTVNEQVAVFPEASVTKNEFVVVPMGKMEPDARPAVWVTVLPEQLSEEVIKYDTAAPHTPGLFAVVILAGQLICGRILSITVTVAVHVELRPLTSVTVSVTTLGPTFEHVN